MAAMAKTVTVATRSGSVCANDHDGLLVCTLPAALAEPSNAFILARIVGSGAGVSACWGDAVTRCYSLGMDEPHLPMERSGFIGRQRDLRELRDLLGRHGLVTLTGPPGVGKTRLAVHLGRLESRHFADGATFLDLAGMTADQLVAAEIAEQLGLSLDSSGNAVSSLAVALEARHVLLILDNCEHVVDGAARVCAGILGRCPRVRIVATSREPLRIDGELLWQLVPLELPAPGASLHELRRAGSAALFAERASAREPGFSLSEANRVDVVGICAAVDGLPLALEDSPALSCEAADTALMKQRAGRDRS